MLYKPTRPTPEQTKNAKLRLFMGLGSTVIGAGFMFAVLPSVIAVIGTVGFLVADVFLFLVFMDQTNQGDSWNINLRNNIEAKYKIDLPKIPDGRIDTEQPISFKLDGVDYTMSYYQDPQTFEPFIVAGNYPVNVDPRSFEK